MTSYLSSRMNAIAPNLTTMVGETVGARLIQKAGSLLSLAKYPASTVQILGAEKALFRALKQRQATPKYGILYHAQLVSKAPAANKGTMSRVLAAKTSLSARIDSFAEYARYQGSTSTNHCATVRASFLARRKTLHGKVDGGCGENTEHQCKTFEL